MSPSKVMSPVTATSAAAFFVTVVVSSSASVRKVARFEIRRSLA
jgi:hypothetical protein